MAVGRMLYETGRDHIIIYKNMDSAQPAPSTRMEAIFTLFDDNTFEAIRRDMGAAQGKEKSMGESSFESALERCHPPLVAKLVLHWGYPECAAFLESLVIDWRGDRDGFQREVMEELLFLHALLPHMASAVPWSETGRQLL